MYLDNITHGDIRISLTVEDCLDLARACDLAQWTIGIESHAGQVAHVLNLPGKTIADPEVRHVLGLYQTLGQLFLAAATAGEAQGATITGAPPPTARKLRKRPPATLPPWMANRPEPAA